MLALFALTGLRRAELRDLGGKDVSTTTREILIRSGKGGKQRLIFFPPSLDNLVAHQLSKVGKGPLFPGRGGQPLSLRSINLIVARTGERAGIENPNPRYKNITPHLLRHSLARNWKRAGGSLESLQRILGHASLKTTMDLYGTESLAETKDNYNSLAHRLALSPTPIALPG
jgi:integrase